MFCKSHSEIVFVKTTYYPLIKQMLGLRHRCSSPPTHKHTGTCTQTHTLTACFQCYHVTAHYLWLWLLSLLNSFLLQLLHKNAPDYVRKAVIYYPIKTARSPFQCSPNIGLIVRITCSKKTEQGTHLESEMHLLIYLRQFHLFCRSPLERL